MIDISVAILLVALAAIFFLGFVAVILALKGNLKKLAARASRDDAQIDIEGE